MTTEPTQKTLQVINEYDDDGRQTPDFLRIRSQMTLVCGADEPTPWLKIQPPSNDLCLIPVHFHPRMGLKLYVIRNADDLMAYVHDQPPKRWAYFCVNQVFVPKPATNP